MKKSLFKIYLVLTSIMTLSTFSYAQVPNYEKRIYLMDVTGSMKGRGGVATEDIFETIKDNLATALSHIKDPNTEVVIIPYTESVYTSIHGTIAEKDTLISQVKRISIMKGDTNIADAWSYGVSQIDSSKINYLFMCTDGIHNHGPSTDEFYRRLEEWRDNTAGSYMFAFYYMLAANAKVKNIKDITDIPCDNIWSVESLDIDAAFIRTSLKHRKNIYEGNSASISFESNNSNVKIGDIGIEIRMGDNPYYTLEKVRMSWFDDRYNFKIVEKVPKTEIPFTTTVDLYISHDKDNYPLVFMTPEKISMEIVNKGPSIVYVSDRKYEGGLGRINFGKVKFKEPFRGPFKWSRGFFEPTLKVPPFSWCVKKDTTTLSKTLYLSFNEEAVRSDGTIIIYPMETTYEDSKFLKMSSTDWKESDNGYTMDLSVKVLPGLGKHTFTGTIPFYSENLDKVNKTDIEDDTLCEWQLKYKLKWAPILWILWIIYAVLVLALVLGVLYLVFSFVRSVIEAASSASSMAVSGSMGGLNGSASAKHNVVNKSSARKAFVSKVKSDEEDVDKECDEYRHAKTTHERARALLRLVDKLEALKKIDPNLNQQAYDKLPLAVKDDLETYWSKAKLPNAKRGAGNWEGEVGNSRFILNHDYVVKTSSGTYKCSDLIKLCKDQFGKDCSSIMYRNGRPDFSSVSIAETKVNFDDFPIGVRGGGNAIQDKAAEAFNVLLKDKIQAGGHADFFEFKDGLVNNVFVRGEMPFVPHECADCATIQVVPTFIHDIAKHAGGISLWKIISESRSFV